MSLKRILFFTVTAIVSASCNSQSEIDTNFLGSPGDPFSSEFSFANSSQYCFDTSKIDFANGYAELSSSSQADPVNVTIGFVGTSSTGTTWDATNSYLRLSQTGSATDLELGSSWTPAWSNLIGYWKFNEGSGAAVSDSVGTYSGSWQGTLGSQWTAGKLNSGGNFDGSTNYVSATSVPPVQNPLTVSAWIYPTSFSQSSFGSGVGGTIVEGNESGNSSGWIFGIQNGGNLWFWPSGGNDRFSNATIALNTWSYIVATYDGTYLRFYINGVLDSKQTMAAPQALTFFKLGSRSWITGYWKGVLDDVSLWDTALSGSAITTIYQHESAKYAGTFTSRVMDGLSTSANWTNFSWIPTSPFFKELPDAGQSETQANYSSQSAGLMDGIVGLWHLDEPAGTSGANSILDNSGNGNNATPAGGVSFGGAGILGAAASFDGNTGYVNAPSVLPLAKYTKSAWVNINSTSAWNNFISGRNVGSSTAFWASAADGGQLSAGHNGNWTQVEDPVPLTPFVWHHVLVTYDSTVAGGTMVLYKDGQVVSTATSISPPTDNTVNFGAYDNSFLLSGSLDEIAIWSRALSASEVIELYRRGSNRIKYQVRTCADAACSTNPAWQGPDNTNQTYFSELNNNAVQNDSADLTASDSVQAGLPSMQFSNFGSLVVSPNRYFQYRAIMESDDTSTNCNYGSGVTWCSPELKSASAGPSHFDPSAPTVSNKTGVSFVSLSNMIETLGTSGCPGGTLYNLSPDNQNWYYWTGAAWGLADGTASKASSASVIAANLSAFATQVGTGNLYFKVFLQSNGSAACSISNLEINGTY